MRWNWFRDKATHQQLRMYWAKGTDNNADYFTKHHPPSHHLPTRAQYVLNAHQVTTLTRLLGARVCSDTDRYSRYFQRTPKTPIDISHCNAHQPINQSS